MATVCVDLESTLPSWYTTAVYAAGTTYVQNDYVIAAAASGLYSGTTAVLWKSLQNDNTGNALEEGAWWTVVADGSAAKPYKSIDDATRFAASGTNDIRIKSSPDHTALSDTYKFCFTGANAGKVEVTGTTDSLSIGDYIGTDDIGFWKISSVASGVITLTVGFCHESFADVTPVTCYKLNPITLGAAQKLQSSGVSTGYSNITCGWNSAFTARNTYGRTYVTGAAISAVNKYYVNLDGFWNYNQNISWNCGGAEIRNCGTYSSMLFCNGTYGVGIIVIDCMLVGGSDNQIKSSAQVINLRHFRCQAIESVSYMENVASIYSMYSTLSVLSGHVNIIAINCKSYYPTSSPAAFMRNYFLSTGKYAKIYVENTEVYGALLFGLSFARTIVQDYNCTIGDCRTYTPEGNIFTDSSTRHTESGLAWRYEPNAITTATSPLEMLDRDSKDFLQVAVAANSQVTATIWCKKSDADSAFEAQFICKGGQLAGITSDVTAVATDSTDWQQLTIQITPTEAGVLRFGFQVWGSATATCHIDDFGVSQ